MPWNSLTNSSPPSAVCRACGYLSYAGDMDVAIAIRTGIIKDQVLYVQAAAGVVADSVPELEWKETEHKARALLRASELVEEGLE